MYMHVYICIMIIPLSHQISYVVPTPYSGWEGIRHAPRAPPSGALSYHIQLTRKYIYICVYIYTYTHTHTYIYMSNALRGIRSP